MKPLRVLIVDDERLARVGLRRQLQALDDIEIVGESRDGREAGEAIDELAPDLVMLDVQMPGLGGIDLVREMGVERMPHVIFVTAHDDHALEAFDLNAVDYVLKPIDPERLADAVRRARRRIASRSDRADGVRRLERLVDELIDDPGTSPIERLAVEKAGKISLVDVATVRWIEAAGNYVRLHADRGTFLARKTMAGLERDLDSGHFLRIGRSAIVNLRRIDHVIPHPDGRYSIRLDDGAELRTSRRYGSALKAFLDRLR